LPVAPGDVVGERYVVGTCIAEGGMGVVCEATHIALGVPVAIKLIRPAFKDDLEFVQRFLNEARRAALLKSEHVARVHDVGQLATGEPYLVMERLEGIVLDSYLQRAGPLLPEDAVALALQVCDGLAEAHAQGVVHRDIKPGNLFLVHLPNGRINVKILDFGISKQVKDDAPSTLTNRDKSLGSPWYMSPEQMMDSSSVDHRSDIWSLGVVLFELLTNQRPFDGATVPEVCAKVLTGGTPSLRDLQPGIDLGLEAVVFRCLAKEPADRFPDVIALADALQPFSSARHDAAGYRSWQPVGELLGSPQATDNSAGSIAPLSTTRRSGNPSRPSLPPSERRARWFGAIGIAGSLALAAVVAAKALSEPEEDPLGIGAAAAGSALAPGPEPIPLDRGNGPLYLAVPGPAAPPPEVVPMPTDAHGLEGLGSTPEDPSAPAPQRPARGWTPRDDHAYGEPLPSQRGSRELSEELGRLRDEYTRSFGTEPEEPSADAERDPAPPAPEHKVEPTPAPPRRPTQKPAPPSAITEAGDRYGL
jgi:eukaryotic-like serine/threonine-protein kinase